MMKALIFYRNKLLELCKSNNLNVNEKCFYFHVSNVNRNILDLNKVINEEIFIKKWDELKEAGYTWINFHAAGVLYKHLFVELDYREYNKQDIKIDTFINYSGFSLNNDGKNKYDLSKKYKIINVEEWKNKNNL